MTTKPPGKEKREITPHKGGRTAHVKLRINPKIKDLFNQIAKERGVSKADLVEEWILKIFNKKKK